MVSLPTRPLSFLFSVHPLVYPFTPSPRGPDRPWTSPSNLIFRNSPHWVYQPSFHFRTGAHQSSRTCNFMTGTGGAAGLGSVKVPEVCPRDPVPFLPGQPEVVYCVGPSSRREEEDGVWVARGWTWGVRVGGRTTEGHKRGHFP